MGAVTSSQALILIVVVRRMCAASLQRPEDPDTVHDDVIVVIDAFHQPAIAIRYEQRHLDGYVARVLGGRLRGQLLVDVGSVLSVEERPARQEQTAALAA